jgi:hypothetical protein
MGDALHIKTTNTLRLLATALATTWLVASTATPAAAADPAGRCDGYYPSQVSGCATNVRINPVRSIYSTSGTYYGWAEQRYSNTRSCRGYQWIRLHVTKPIPIARYDDGSLGWITVTLYSQPNTNHYVSWSSGRTTSIGVGTYNLRLLYAPNDPLCGIIFARPGVGSDYRDLIFGHRGVEYPFCT